MCIKFSKHILLYAVLFKDVQCVNCLFGIGCNSYLFLSENMSKTPWKYVNFNIGFDVIRVIYIIDTSALNGPYTCNITLNSFINIKK